MLTTRSRTKQRGVILILLAMMITVLLGFLGLAIDVGFMMWMRRRAQTAADAAAITAVLELKRNSTISVARSEALADAGLNGFTTGTANTTVTVNNPPLSGPRAGDNQYVEAIITRNVPAFFMRVVGRNSMDIAARAVGRIGSAGNACIYALNPTVNSAFFASGNMNVVLSCGIAVASSGGRAYNMNGGAEIRMVNDDRPMVVGGWDISGQSRIIDHNGNEIQPVRTSSVTDPFASVPNPTRGSLPRFNGRITYDMNSLPPLVNGRRTIPPGVYCGGLKILNTGGQTFYMDGQYIMAGGGFSAMSQARITGTNTTIFNSEGSLFQCSGNQAYDPIDLEGQAVLDIKAPTSGTYEGIAFFQDRRVNPGSRDNKFVGGSTMVIDGALYFPTSPVLFSGNSGASGYMFIVGDTVRFNGNSQIGNNYTTLEDGNPIKSSSVLTE
ncbi:MAG TPA: pilus assembly protein TadG-related protein [Bryobacteraceae bacterium]|nr:pilus assembly protein TadG-related protein [Bryobacteraceae bacterium]